MLSSPALEGSKETAYVEEYGSAGPHFDSINKFRRNGLISSWWVPFSDVPVGIQTTLLIERARRFAVLFDGSMSVQTHWKRNGRKADHSVGDVTSNTLR